MKSFAFIVTPINIEQLKELWPPIRLMPNFLLKPTLKKISPFKLSHVKNFQSAQACGIEGFIIICPLFTQNKTESQEEFIIDKIIDSGRLCENLGVKIMGLNSYTSLIEEKIIKVAKNIKVPITAGNALTAWSIFEAIYRFTKSKKINLKKSTLAIVGATTAVGNLCSKKLCEYVKKIILISEDEKKTERIRETILEINSIEVVIEQNLDIALKEADVVVDASLPQEEFIQTSQLKKDTIFCQIFGHKQISGELNDVTVLNAGLIKLPQPVDLGLDFKLPDNVISSSIAETMLLTLEEKFVDYSLGDNINPDKLEEIADIAAKHGFEVWVPEAPIM